MISGYSALLACCAPELYEFAQIIAQRFNEGGNTNEQLESLAHLASADKTFAFLTLGFKQIKQKSQTEGLHWNIYSSFVDSTNNLALSGTDSNHFTGLRL